MKVVITGVLTDEVLREDEVERLIDLLMQFGVEDIKIESVEE